MPVHTPENALLSKAYATKQAGVSSDVHAKIDKSLEIFGVTLPDQVSVKVASENIVYAIPDKKLFPLNVSEGVKNASEALRRNKKKLAPKTYAAASVAIVKEAAYQGIDVDEDILRNAGLMQCDTHKTAEWIEARALAAPDSADAYLKLASIVKNADENTTREDLTKVASAVQELDDNSGLSKYYGKSLPNPQETVFNSKIAMGKSLELAGKEVPISKLLGLSPSDYGDVLGDDMIEEISSDGNLSEQKLLEVLPTLPMDMKDMLVRKLGL